MADGIKVPPYRPYIVRAMYDWMLDNMLTPQIAVNVNYPLVDLPLQYAQNGMIILNISPRAVLKIKIDNQGLSFDARFGGVPHSVYVPMIAVSSIYPREDPKLGMYLFPEAAYDDYYENCDSGSSKTHLSAVEEVSSGDHMTEDERKKIDSSAKEHKKPTLEIVE